MKKYLVAASVAVLVFAFAAMAASLTVDDGTLAAGIGDVTDCTDSAEVTYGDPVVSDAGVWMVDSATVSVPGCANGKNVSLALDTGTFTSVGTSTVNSGTATFDFAAVASDSIEYHSVLVKD